jgi:hypothetical protein
MNDKQCHSCNTVYTTEQWLSLALVGYQGDGFGGRLELRNCPCGDTMAIVAEPESRRRRPELNNPYDQRVKKTGDGGKFPCCL